LRSGSPGHPDRGDKKVRIYSELDADCGKRRKKRNKSEYFAGYRLHTLVVLDPQTGHHKTVKTPEHVDPKRRQVFCDAYCEIPLRYLGSTDSGHEFGCDASPHECFRAPLCPQGREIPFDSGQFGQMPDILPEVNRVRLLRKHMERSYNLFKHRAGLEHLRLKSHPVVQAAATVAHLATVLAAIAAHHHQAGKEKRPKQLPLAA